jgi:hypothetical protein
VGIISQIRGYWWELRLSCGHTVERIVTYRPDPTRTRQLRGWARLHAGKSQDLIQPAPKRARCEYCGGDTTKPRGRTEEEALTVAGPSKPSKPTEGPCAYPGCKITCDGDFYCYGCQKFTCEDHNTVASPPMGPHGVEDHWTEKDEHDERWFPVTDPDIDAPDGAVVDGYERHGDRWVKVRP